MAGSEGGRSHATAAEHNHRAGAPEGRRRQDSPQKRPESVYITTGRFTYTILSDFALEVELVYGAGRQIVDKPLDVYASKTEIER